MALIRKEFPNVDLLYYFSDGAPSQYKNYKNFSNLYYHLHDYGIQAEWHFFTINHGKSPCDGIGGTAKHLVATASLQNTYILSVLSVRDMFDWCIKNIEGISFLLVSSEEVEEIIQTCELEKQYVIF